VAGVTTATRPESETDCLSSVISMHSTRR
jgi:hypothetical protein